MSTESRTTCTCTVTFGPQRPLRAFAVLTRAEAGDRDAQHERTHYYEYADAGTALARC